MAAQCRYSHHHAFCVHLLRHISLQLWETPLGAGRLDRIFSALLRIKSICHLNLGDCQLTPADGTNLSRLLAHCGSMDLSENELQCSGISKIMAQLPLGPNSPSSTSEWDSCRVCSISGPDRHSNKSCRSMRNRCCS